MPDLSPLDEVKRANHVGRLDVLEMSVRKQNLLKKNMYTGILFRRPPRKVLSFLGVRFGGQLISAPG